MSYGIALSVEAEHNLIKIPIPVRRHIFRQLEILENIPPVLKPPSHWPYRDKCQLFQFDYDHDRLRWEISVLFQYGQDEKTIHVLMIGFSSTPINEAEHRAPPDPE